ncbi:MAG: NHL repeat-containing protein [Candidatus Latescibacterota bacterium]|nr:MAG: NHL repeat-containing protein [Candidatus Latescibacterota bacterium]
MIRDGHTPRLFASLAVLGIGLMAGCASQNVDVMPVAGGEEPEAIYSALGGITPGDPRAVAIDFSGNVFVADGLPGRIVFWIEKTDESLEFQRPTQQAGFNPSDVGFHGFFIYGLDPVTRNLLRFDNRGAYRDILISFDAVVRGARTTPVGFDVEQSGRIAVTDIQNHQVILFDSYLSVELVFGSYGSSPGQFDAPEGITFTSEGGFLVADTGNRRVQRFDAGGRYVSSIPPSGESNPMVRPRRAVIDTKGNVYVADPEANRVFVFGEDGVLIRTIVPAGVSRFEPMDVEVTRTERIFVLDAANNSLFVFR